MKNFFANIFSTIIAFILISLGVYAVDEMEKKRKRKEKDFEKDIEEDLDIVNKKSSKKKGS